MVKPWKPTKEQLAGACEKTVPDVIGADLKVLFVGINPGLYSAAVGHHFARPGNRFWPALHAAGFTEQLFSPFAEQGLLKLGYGITNLVDRATAAAAELSAKELVAGRKRLEAKAHRYRPAFVALVGVTSYRIAFARPQANVGLQEERMGTSRIWVLPNPSGLNAHYQPGALARVFGDLRRAAHQGEPKE